ncbi:MAG TPA: D-aminoacylase [Bryobacteraceae bacterium]|jgi:dihydroorotase/N-acyl-D-amino-acid deacylase
MYGQKLLLRGGTLIDGTGAPAQRGDLLISGDAIEAVGKFDPPSGIPSIDCTGMAISPGFIDAHSHSDLQVLGEKTEKLQQGVTAEVVGNCGFSPYPASEHRHELHQFANGIFCGDDSWGWKTAHEYLADIQRKGKHATVGSLIGHGSLRIAAAGNKMGALTSAELERMEGMLADALAGGATGFSTGLMYAPGSSAPFGELERLCSIVARSGKIYCTHIRDYSFHLSEAVDEQLELARRTGCRLQISHLQTTGRMNWGKQQQVVEKIEAARNEGVDVAFDCYPYIAGSTVLTQLLPQDTLDGGTEKLMERLASPPEREKIAKRTLEKLPHRWCDVLISAVGSSANKRFIGMTIEEAAQERHEQPIDTMLNLLAEERGEVNMISFNQSEENLRQTLTHPLAIVISDGFYVKGRPHPRLYGTFPRLLGFVARENKWMTLEEAVHKITGRPAERFGFEKRGFLRPSYIADLVVFDPATVDSPATFSNPEVPPVGIRSVFRNGNIAWAQ